MDTIILLLQGVGVVILLALGIAVLLFPISLDLSYKEHAGKGCINYWLTALEAICFLAVSNYWKDTTSDGFNEALGCLVIVLIISIVVSRKKAKKWNLDKWNTFLVAAAQIMSPVSIFFLILMISSAVQAIKGDKDEAKK